MAIAQRQELIDSGEVDVYEEEVPQSSTQSTATRRTVKSETITAPTEQQEDEPFILLRHRNMRINRNKKQ